MSDDIRFGDNITFIGDVHSHINSMVPMLRAGLKSGSNTFIQVGDFSMELWRFIPQLQEKIDSLCRDFGIDHITIYFIDGNHDDYPILPTSSHDPVEFTPSIIYLPRGWTGTINYVSLMTFGGASSHNRAQLTPGLDWFPEENIKESDYRRAMMNTDEIDVLVTHDSVSNVFSESITKGKDDAPGISNRIKIDSVVDTMKPKFLVHGHHHRPIRGTRGETEVIGLDKESTRGSVASLSPFALTMTLLDMDGRPYGETIG